MNKEKKIFTDSGIEIKKVYTAENIQNNTAEIPGQAPFTRGVQADMYRGGCSGLSYVLGFDAQKESDQEYFFEGIHFIMEKAHEMYLYGMEIDWQNGLNNRGFTFKNPNASTTCGCGSSFAV